MFKIMKGLEVVESEKNLNMKARKRRHSLSYNKESFKRRIRNNHAFFVGERHNFLFNRVAPSWNMLPSNVYDKLFEFKRL